MVIGRVGGRQVGSSSGGSPTAACGLLAVPVHIAEWHILERDHSSSFDKIYDEMLFLL